MVSTLKRRNTWTSESTFNNKQVTGYRSQPFCHLYDVLVSTCSLKKQNISKKKIMKMIHPLGNTNHEEETLKALVICFFIHSFITILQLGMGIALKFVNTNPLCVSHGFEEETAA